MCSPPRWTWRRPRRHLWHESPSSRATAECGSVVATVCQMRLARAAIDRRLRHGSAARPSTHAGPGRGGSAGCARTYVGPHAGGQRGDFLAQTGDNAPPESAGPRATRDAAGPCGSGLLCAAGHARRPRAERAPMRIHPHGRAGWDFALPVSGRSRASAITQKGNYTFFLGN